MKSILAIDLGTRTGWAHRSIAGLISSGVADFKPGRFDGGGMRFLRFSRWIEQVTAGVDVIYFEEVRRHRGVDAAHIYGGLMAHLTAFCESESIPYSGVPVGTMKRHWTGKGNADKAMMIEAAKARGFSPADDNEADALAILGYAINL
jgi:Holliday junction resolvasome RuvABC endonuclease subunit